MYVACWITWAISDESWAWSAGGNVVSELAGYQGRSTGSADVEVIVTIGSLDRWAALMYIVM